MASLYELTDGMVTPSVLRAQWREYTGLWVSWERAEVLVHGKLGFAADPEFIADAKARRDAKIADLERENESLRASLAEHLAKYSVVRKFIEATEHDVRGADAALAKCNTTFSRRLARAIQVRVAHDGNAAVRMTQTHLLRSAADGLMSRRQLQLAVQGTTDSLTSTGIDLKRGSLERKNGEIVFNQTVGNGQVRVGANQVGAIEGPAGDRGVEAEGDHARGDAAGTVGANAQPAGAEVEVAHPSLRPFKCPVCNSTYFSSLWDAGELVGRYCKGWPAGHDRSYIPCKGRYEELYAVASKGAR